MIKKKLKEFFIYGNFRYFPTYYDKLLNFFFIALIPKLDKRLRKTLSINGSNSLLQSEYPSNLNVKNFLNKKALFKNLIGLDILLISKTGKNLFVNWLDVYGRLKSTKSLMTLKDPKKQITKKQKSFSVYFLLKKFGKDLRKRYKLSKIALLLKGSIGIRRKKSFIIGLTHSGLKIRYITDITNIPFNGCRLKKKKRL